MIKIAFTADAHLGQEQYGLPFRQADYIQALFQVAEQAKGCDVMVFGGDMFHVPRPPSGAVQALRQVVQTFVDSNSVETSRGVRAPWVLSIDGNHDNTDGDWMSLCGAIPLDWKADVDVDGHPSVFHVRMAGEEDVVRCRIVGVNGGSNREILRKLENLGKDPKAKADILVLHLPLSEASGFPTPVSAQQIAGLVKPCGVKLVLLGDIHDGKEVVAQGIRFVYSGSPEITAANEVPEKSFLVVSFDIDTGAFDVQRVPIRIRPQKVVAVEKEEDIEKLASMLDRETLFHVQYDGSIPRAKDRLLCLLKAQNAKFRLLTIPKFDNKPRTFTNRTGFRATFAEVVEEDLKGKPEAKEMLLEMNGLPPELAMEPPKKCLRKHGIRSTVLPR